jgi:hypothetical protein
MGATLEGGTICVAIMYSVPSVIQQGGGPGRQWAQSSEETVSEAAGRLCKATAYLDLSNQPQGPGSP